jgi:hypothetical protein
VLWFGVERTLVLNRSINERTLYWTRCSSVRTEILFCGSCDTLPGTLAAGLPYVSEGSGATESAICVSLVRMRQGDDAYTVVIPCLEIGFNVETTVERNLEFVGDV